MQVFLLQLLDLVVRQAYPTAIFAAIRAMGYPVAFDASAEERLTRGLTSITRISPVN